MHFDSHNLYSKLVGNSFVVIAEDEVMENLLLTDRETRGIVMVRRPFMGSAWILTIPRQLVRRAKIFGDHYEPHQFALLDATASGSR